MCLSEAQYWHLVVVADSPVRSAPSLAVAAVASEAAVAQEAARIYIAMDSDFRPAAAPLVVAATTAADKAE
jgi:hypothetical protein